MIVGAIIGFIVWFLYFVMNLMFNANDLEDHSEKVNWIAVIISLVLIVGAGIASGFLFGL